MATHHLLVYKVAAAPSHLGCLLPWQLTALLTGIAATERKNTGGGWRPGRALAPPSLQAPTTASQTLAGHLA